MLMSSFLLVRLSLDTSCALVTRVSDRQKTLLGMRTLPTVADGFGFFAAGALALPPTLDVRTAGV